jgi:CHAT domain-containing protein
VPAKRLLETSEPHWELLEQQYGQEAGSAIASLWSVGDETSADLTKEFYTQLLKPQVTKAEALRQAQLALMKTDKYEHPKHWSPYILTGNWL